MSSSQKETEEDKATRRTEKDKYNRNQLNPEADGKQNTTFRKKEKHLYLRFQRFGGFLAFQ